MVLGKRLKFTIRHGKILSIFCKLQYAVCGDRHQVLNIFLRKQPLKFFNVIPCKELFFKMPYRIFICEVFLDTRNKAAIQVIIIERRIHGDKRHQNDSIFFCNPDGFVYCLADVLLIV